MQEVIFLWVLALIWIIFATIQDFKKREVANWLNFSLIIFALGFRFFYSLFSDIGFGFFIQGLIGLGIFFILGNFFYKAHLFAGGDTKLLISLGAILPFSNSFFVNLKIFIIFLFLFLVIGSVYGIFWSIFLALKNKKKFNKEFKKLLGENMKLIYTILVFALIIVVLGFLIEPLVAIVGFLIFILPYVYLYAKSIDEACMIAGVRPKELTEGDWLYKNIKIGRKIIKADWEGLTKEDIKLIQKKFKNKKILIRQGIPFVPVFLIVFLLIIYLFKINFVSLI